MALTGLEAEVVARALDDGEYDPAIALAGHRGREGLLWEVEALLDLTDALFSGFRTAPFRAEDALYAMAQENPHGLARRLREWSARGLQIDLFPART